MFVIKHRKFFYIFTLTLLAASLASVLFFGLKLGLDFTGGSLLEVEYLNKRPDIPELEERFLLLGYSGAKFQPASEKGLIVRLRDLTEEEHGIVMRALAEGGEPPQVLIEKRFDSVGPTIGSELKRNSLIAILLSMCQPGRPAPQGDSQLGSPGLTPFHSTKSSGSCLASSTSIRAPIFRSSIFLRDSLP